jgi:hypothetical protein
MSYETILGRLFGKSLTTEASFAVILNNLQEHSLNNDLTPTLKQTFDQVIKLITQLHAKVAEITSEYNQLQAVVVNTGDKYKALIGQLRDTFSQYGVPVTQTTGTTAAQQVIQQAETAAKSYGRNNKYTRPVVEQPMQPAVAPNEAPDGESFDSLFFEGGNDK